MNKTILGLAGVLALSILVGCATPPSRHTTESIASILSASDRTDADRANDTRRKAPQMLAVIDARMNNAVFAALKSGGHYVIADHSGRPGSGITESKTLHRIEEALLRLEVEAAGFRLVEEGQFLRNPNDPRDQSVIKPAQPNDEFVLKFVKP